MKLFFCCLLFLVAMVTLGNGELPLREVLDGAWERIMGHSDDWNALLDERLPRLIVLVCSGASLAVAGAVMQALFQNALASPSILGVTPGGSLVAMLVLTTGYHLVYPVLWPLAAVIGCMGSLFLVYGLSKRQGSVQMHQLILTGIALSTLFITIQSVLVYVLRDQWHLTQTLADWEAASTLNRSWLHVHMQLPLTVVGLIGCWHYRNALDLLSLGEEEAWNLGVDVNKVRWRLFLCVSLLTGGTIAAVGMIAFFGLVLPHLLRMISGPRNGVLIPLCLLGGGAVLPMLDSGLRLFHIHAMTVGNVSAILGGLFFIFMLFGSRWRLQPC